jgi:hypothetical protein
LDGAKLGSQAECGEWLGLKGAGQIPTVLAQDIQVVIGGCKGPFEAEGWRARSRRSPGQGLGDKILEHEGGHAIGWERR